MVGDNCPKKARMRFPGRKQGRSGKLSEFTWAGWNDGRCKPLGNFQSHSDLVWLRLVIPSSFSFRPLRLLSRPCFSPGLFVLGLSFSFLFLVPFLFSFFLLCLVNRQASPASPSRAYRYDYPQLPIKARNDSNVDDPSSISKQKLGRQLAVILRFFGAASVP